MAAGVFSRALITDMVTKIVLQDNTYVNSSIVVVMLYISKIADQNIC